MAVVLPLPTTTRVELVRVTKALFDAAPGYTYLTAFEEAAGQLGGVAGVVNALLPFATDKPNDAEAVADLIVNNLKLTGDVATAAKDYLVAQFQANPGNFGQVIVDAMNALATLVYDPVFGPAAQAFNASIAKAYAYSIDSANSTTDLTTLQAADEVETDESGQPVVPGQTFTLTTGVDNITGTSGNDTFIIDNTQAAKQLSVADQIDGAAGTDVAKIYQASGDAIDAVPLSAFSNVEKFYINNGTLTGGETLDISGKTEVTSLEIDSPTAIADNATFTIKGATGQSVTLKNIDGSTGGNDDILKVSGITDITISGWANTDQTVLDIGGTDTAVTLTSTGKASTLKKITNSGNKLESLTIKGDADLTANDAAVSFAAGKKSTVDASAFTGKLDLDLSGNQLDFTGGSGDTTIVAGSTDDTITTGAGNDNVTSGGGNDTIKTGAGNDTIKMTDSTTSNLTKDDVIDGGDGIDTIVVTETTLGANDKANAAGVSNVEVIDTDAAADVSVDFAGLSVFNIVKISGADTIQTATTGAAGTTSVTVTNAENEDVLVVAAARSGQHGDATKDGGDAINIQPKLDNGSNVATIKFEGAVTLDGGDGGAESVAGNNDAGNGGDGIDAAKIETLNIEVIGTGTTASTVAITGGNAGTTTAATNNATAGKDIIVESNGKVVLTSSLSAEADANGNPIVHNNINLGTVYGNNVEVDGSAFKGDITVTTAQGNTIIKGGEGDDTLTGAAGIDTISGGAGDDTIDGKVGADIITVGDGNDVVTVAVGESTTSAYDKISGFSLATTSWGGSGANDEASEFQSTGVAGNNADLLDLGGTLSIEADATNQTASATIDGSSTTFTYSVKNGILTVSNTGSAVLDTLAEWASVAGAVAASTNETLAFEFDGNTYVFSNQSTDILVELTGITGVAGIDVLANTGTVGGDGYIMIV